MESITTRVIELRKALKLSQRGLGDAIGLSNSGVSNIENGIRNVTDQHIKLLVAEFHVSEHWLRTGEGDMFSQTDTFSLDEMAKRSNLSDLEKAIMCGYMELAPEVRKAIMEKAESIIAARAAQMREEDEIEAEVAAYRKELEAEKRAEISSASDERKSC